MVVFFVLNAWMLGLPKLFWEKTGEFSDPSISLEQTHTTCFRFRTTKKFRICSPCCSGDEHIPESSHQLKPPKKNRPPTVIFFARFCEDEMRVLKGSFFLGGNLWKTFSDERGRIDLIWSQLPVESWQPKHWQPSDVGRWWWEIGRGGLFTKTRTEVGGKSMILVARCSYSIWLFIGLTHCTINMGSCLPPQKISRNLNMGPLMQRFDCGPLIPPYGNGISLKICGGAKSEVGFSEKKNVCKIHRVRSMFQKLQMLKGFKSTIESAL